MSSWNASNYNQRKAARLAMVKPEWIINPDTGEEFYLRKVGGLMSSVLAGYMPAGFTSVAVEAWKEQGVEGLEPADMAALAATLTPEQRAAGERETKTIARIVQTMCVIPLLSNNIPEETPLTKEWIEAASKGMKEKDPHFDPETFDFKSLVFDPAELDEADTMFLFKWAKGLGAIAVKGGNVITAGNFRQIPKKLNRSPRTSADKSAIREAS
jgi:hypothetical protein